jgi:hypothetical protein
LFVGLAEVDAKFVSRLRGPNAAAKGPRLPPVIPPSARRGTGAASDAASKSAGGGAATDPQGGGGDDGDAATTVPTSGAVAPACVTLPVVVATITDCDRGGVGAAGSTGLPLRIFSKMDATRGRFALPAAPIVGSAPNDDEPAALLSPES